MAVAAKAPTSGSAAHGVRSVDYANFSLAFASLMSDGRHFTYYNQPCRETFPEMAEVLAKLAFLRVLAEPSKPPIAICAPQTRSDGEKGKSR